MLGNTKPDRLDELYWITKLFPKADGPIVAIRRDRCVKRKGTRRAPDDAAMQNDWRVRNGVDLIPVHHRLVPVLNGMLGPERELCRGSGQSTPVQDAADGTSLRPKSSIR